MREYVEKVDVLGWNKSSTGVSAGKLVRRGGKRVRDNNNRIRIRGTEDTG